jgi:quercetin dioxygenase-like cupin family protein
MERTKRKEDNMRANVMWVFGAGALIISLVCVSTLRATPAGGFSGSTIAVGRFGEIDVNNHAFFPDTAPWNSHPGNNLWLSMQKTKGPSDLYVQNNVWASGGTTGWHTHPGHSLIIVTAGTVTAYDGDDPSCTPHQYAVGEGFVDAGGDHVHLLRNEGAVEARTIAVQLIPAGAIRRIDAAASPYCSF